MPALIRPLLAASLLALAFSAAPVLSLSAQEHAPVAAQAHGEVAESSDYITPHITDSHHLEIPYWKAPFYKEIELPHSESLVFHAGNVLVDLNLTKHVVFMLLAATLAAVLLVGAASSSRAGHKMNGRPKGFASAVEALALNLRNEVILPNVGPHGEKFVPFALTLFFFILLCNLLGMFPFGSTATGNISVTATLAIITFFVVEITGIRAQGWGYLSTMFYWNKDLPMIMRVPMFILMSPIEIFSKITKPFALTIRLFANMTAGHIVLLALIGLIFAFGSYWIAAAPIAMAAAMSVLELFVSFVQAFIFTLLASAFIGQIRTAHH